MSNRDTCPPWKMQKMCFIRSSYHRRRVVTIHRTAGKGNGVARGGAVPWKTGSRQGHGHEGKIMSRKRRKKGQEISRSLHSLDWVLSPVRNLITGIIPRGRKEPRFQFRQLKIILMGKCTKRCKNFSLATPSASGSTLPLRSHITSVDEGQDHSPNPSIKNHIKGKGTKGAKGEYSLYACSVGFCLSNHKFWLRHW